jgi:hypothetical protein
MLDIFETIPTVQATEERISNQINDLCDGFLRRVIEAISHAGDISEIRIPAHNGDWKLLNTIPE